MQTKKRAKPVKFGVKPKEAEKKEELTAARQESVETPVEEPQEVTTAASEAAAPKPSEPAHSAAPAHGGELVDKLSDVPFETDFGSPSTEPAAPAAPHPLASTATEPAAFSATSTNPAESHEPEEIASTDSTQPISAPIDISPDATIPPIGRANEPIPFNPHETVFNTPPDASEKKKNPFLYFLIIAFVAFVTGIAFMAGIYYAMPDKNFFAMPSIPSIPGISQPTPTAVPVVQTPTAAPTTTVKLADYTIRVLNGSGISGQAAKVKAALEAQGFTVTSVGNAETSDVTKTQITVKKSVSKDAVEKVKDVLKKTYALEKETELPVTATKESDITITIGKETAK